MRLRIRSFRIGLGLLAALLGAQAVPAPRFEVASVKEHQGRIPRIGVSTSGFRLTAEACSLSLLLTYAYDIKGYQLIRTPELLRGNEIFYDIMAVAEGPKPPSTAEFRQMLRVLLADRFGLVAHTETRQMPVYGLVVRSGGSKLKPSAPEVEAEQRLTVVGRDYRVTNPKASAEDIVSAVSNSFPDRPVIDRTDLTGTYRLDLRYTPNLRSTGEPAPEDIDIFTAVQQQLGLQLQPDKAAMTVLVVDRVGVPSGN